MLGLRDAGDDDLGDLDPDWVAEAMLAAVPVRLPSDSLGPFYDTSGLTQWLGVSRQAIHQRVKGHKILALDTGDEQRLYPSWQFLPDGSMLPGLASVLPVLLERLDSRSAAAWLTEGNDAFGGESAVDLLSSGPKTHQDSIVDRILAAARVHVAGAA